MLKILVICLSYVIFANCKKQDNDCDEFLEEYGKYIAIAGGIGYIAGEGPAIIGFGSSGIASSSIASAI